MRILRDVSELWKFRSLIKAAATRRFTYFPDIGWLMAFLWHIHQHPVCLSASRPAKSVIYKICLRRPCGMRGGV